MILTAAAVSSSQEDDELTTLDRHVAPGLRLWMLIALVSGVLLIMVVLVCCFMRIRIPRTKRQIELMAAKRKLRNRNGGIPTTQRSHTTNELRSQTIVMNSLSVPTRLMATATGGASSSTLYADSTDDGTTHTTANNSTAVCIPTAAAAATVTIASAAEHRSTAV